MPNLSSARAHAVTLSAHWPATQAATADPDWIGLQPQQYSGQSWACMQAEDPWVRSIGGQPQTRSRMSIAKSDSTMPVGALGPLAQGLFVSTQEPKAWSSASQPP